MATNKDATNEPKVSANRKKRISKEQQEAAKKINKNFSDISRVLLESLNDAKTQVLSYNNAIAEKRLADTSIPLQPPPEFKCYGLDELKGLVEEQLKGMVRLACHAPYCVLSTPVGGVMCATGTHTCVKLITYDQAKNKMTCGGERVLAHLMASEYSTITCTIQDNHNGSYAISFTAPQTPGLYELHVYINEQEHIMNCSIDTIYSIYDCSVKVYASRKSLAVIAHKQGRNCAIKGDNLIVSSREKLSCFKLSNYKDCQQIDKFKFKKPRGIVVYGNDLLVADTVLNKVVKITDSGSCCVIESLLNSPLSMCLDEKEEKLYVANMKGKCIDVYEVKESGMYPKVGQIDLPHNPYDLAFDADMNLHIACGEQGNTDGIIVCNRSGERHSLSGYGRGELNGPGGIAIDKNGFIYTTEYTTSGRLVVFNPQGHKVFSSASFTHPMGVCVSDDGRVFVACNMQGGVLVF